MIFRREASLFRLSRITGREELLVFEIESFAFDKGVVLPKSAEL